MLFSPLHFSIKWFVFKHKIHIIVNLCICKMYRFNTYLTFICIRQLLFWTTVRSFVSFCMQNAYYGWLSSVRKVKVRMKWFIAQKVTFPNKEVFKQIPLFSIHLNIPIQNQRYNRKCEYVKCLAFVRYHRIEVTWKWIWIFVE